MADSTCGVCNSAPKKYKCPTCALPYCSIPCFREHKQTHPEGASAAPAPQPVVEVELPSATPETIPTYIRTKRDFSRLATDTHFQTLLKSNPTLLSTLQRVYAATIKPEDGDAPQRRGMRGRGGSRGRGGRGRGRGRGGWGGGDGTPRWTQKQGDNDALTILKSLREGNTTEGTSGMGEFVRLVEEMYGDAKQTEGEGDAMDTL
ncbi:hypothetical protein DPSP01_003397 [Paraphaeosphaeria sporulosa]|uniref:HIT-type domain-containing protein n=1 Tax=Paraphaeosphaeria sporulosa TaxID=1460663 RepID=A0A177CD54_9PLEO|nr:uncharacterized protein CC84DRAFT_1148319 [Paraphaeosphaeria sporulosa]OAG05131.1 hypothetical protein CC84DRAFT_1148319 [Paraphaeosphaeria sporulosa]